MLNFLNTAVLAAVAVALLPLLLHLFSRRKVKIVPFSSIVYLRAMRKHQVRAIKIRQILLLIIRTLIILAVVLAFARPATRGGYLGAHGAVSAVIVIDNSASMGASSRDGILFDLALRKAKEIIDQIGQADEAAVMTTTGPLSRPRSDQVFGNAAAARALLGQVVLTDLRADLTSSVGAACALASDRTNLNREVFLISDLQESSFSRDSVISPGKSALYLVDLSVPEASNNSIVALDFGGQLIETGTPFPLTATIASRAASGREDILVSLYLDDKRIAQEVLPLEPGETGTVRFEVMVNSAGYHSGYVFLSDDDLLADNRAYYSLYIPDQFSVLLAGQDDAARRLFRLALSPDEQLRRHWSITEVEYSRFSEVRLDRYDMVILADYSTLSDGDAMQLRDYVKNGGGLLVNIGRRSDSAHYAAYLADMTGVELHSSFPAQVSRSGYYLLSDFDLTHPLLNIFGAASEKPAFKAFARLKAALAAGADVDLLARYSDGSPAVTVSRFGRGRVMYLGCDVGPDLSDISLHPFFVPFVTRSCEYLSGDFSAPAASIPAGGSATRPLRRSFTVGDEYQLLMPDSSRRLITAEFIGGTPTVKIDQLDRSGIYHILNGTTESDRLAVNVDPAEGDLYPVDDSDLERIFPGVQMMPRDLPASDFIAEKRFGREWWPYFIMAALVLLGLEMFVARDRGHPLPENE